MRLTARAIAPTVAVLSLAVAVASAWNRAATLAAPPPWAPSIVPDRVLLSATTDLSTTQAVTWRTSTAVRSGQARAQIALASPRPNPDQRATTVKATTERFVTDAGVAHAHAATLTGLTPDTLYVFRVGDGKAWSEWFQLRTAPATPKPFSFVYFGDAQVDIKSQWSQVIRRAYAERPDIRLLVHAGDLINSRSDAEWGEWHHAGGWINGMVPSLPAPGNHEYRGGSLSPNWRPQFHLPANGPAGLEETCYFLDYQGVRFVVLNTEEKQAEQALWLDRTLTGNPNHWTVLVFHRPMFSSTTSRDNDDLRDLWLPVIHKHNVDLVLQGHDHTYGRSQNLRDGIPALSGEHGTVFVVSVSGPKMYPLKRQSWMRSAAEGMQLFQLISVDGDSLAYEARTADGALYDAFRLEKGKDGAPNRLVERAPGS